MPIDPKHVGKKYGPTTYHLGLEKMREFAYAVAGGVPTNGLGGGPPPGLNPLLWDAKAASDGPHGSVVAFPTFPVTFAIEPFIQALTDPALGINMLKLVHGEQDFELFELMKPGDVMTSTGVIAKLFEKSGMDFVVFETESRNQHGKLVAKGTWTAVIRH